MQAIPYQQYKTYKKNQVEMASAEELVLLCYKGAIKYLKQAVLKWDQNEHETVHNLLMTTQALLEELTLGLNIETGEIAENLLQLYDYMHRRLVEANNKKDVAPVKEVIGILEGIKEAWEGALLDQKALKNEQKGIEDSGAN